MKGSYCSFSLSLLFCCLDWKSIMIQLVWDHLTWLDQLVSCLGVRHGFHFNDIYYWIGYTLNLYKLYFVLRTQQYVAFFFFFCYIRNLELMYSQSTFQFGQSHLLPVLCLWTWVFDARLVLCGITFYSSLHQYDQLHAPLFFPFVLLLSTCFAALKAVVATLFYFHPCPASD